MKVLALDGHDAAGKTTLAQLLAQVVGAQYVRPFGGRFGKKLIESYQAGRHLETLAIGHQAILSAFENKRQSERLVMDRGWVTVATLVPRSVFAEHWTMWIPSTLLWCDEATTLARLKARELSENEPNDWHANFLLAYLDRFNLHLGEVLRTDQLTEVDCIDHLKRIFEETTPFQLVHANQDRG